jgi:uncharacterized protein (DUF488 family)
MAYHVFTIGHSTHPIEEFIAILKAHEVEKLADIRTVPRSRYNPQFNADALAKSLSGENIEYRPFKGLGGLRHARKDSPNQGWKNASFRGYADYMQTPEFEMALDELLAWAGESKTVLMCAESVPWRCHRSLVADALLARGITATHIMSATNAKPHEMTSFAEVKEQKVLYPFALT